MNTELTTEFRFGEATYWLVKEIAEETTPETNPANNEE